MLQARSACRPPACYANRTLALHLLYTGNASVALAVANRFALKFFLTPPLDRRRAIRLAVIHLAAIRPAVQCRR